MMIDSAAEQNKENSANVENVVPTETKTTTSTQSPITAPGLLPAIPTPPSQKSKRLHVTNIPFRFREYDLIEVFQDVTFPTRHLKYTSDPGLVSKVT
eukprot:sb/3479042/